MIVALNQIAEIKDIGMHVRKKIIQEYGSTFGRCIDASDLICEILTRQCYIVETKQVWVLYEYFENCTDLCYEEHWLVNIRYKGKPLYLDVTMDQFQWAFSKKLPELYLETKLPNFYLPRKPGKVVLDRCGWTDWYNKGNYINNFRYWN